VIWGKQRQRLGHNWETWGTCFERWIAFHQSTFGKAGQPRNEQLLDATDFTRKNIAERAARAARAEDGFLSWLL
jgi:hypothetical protein